MFDIKQSLAQKQNLHLSLKLWLPILQAGSEELERTVEQICLENPYLEMTNSRVVCATLSEGVKKSKKGLQAGKNRLDSDLFLVERSDSFYSFVEKQIDSNIFPTNFSKNIAFDIVESLSEDGFFEGNMQDIANRHNTTIEKVESIRQRFRMLEPSGIGALDFKESFLFQITNLEIDEDLHMLASEMIEHFDELSKFTTRSRYKDAMKLISTLKTQPAIDFMEDSQVVTPDILIEFDGDDLAVRVDNFYGFDISLVEAPKSGEFSREKQKEAREISGLLSLRKTTLHNIANIIAQKQFKFFCGGSMVPLKMQEIADMLGFNQSTVSRAVSGKYIACDRGVFAMKEFFSSSLGEEVAPFEIKEFVRKCIDNEDREHPVSDEEMQIMVQRRFGLDIVRRTITKYRDELGFASSKDRKKYYRLCA